MDSIANFTAFFLEYACTAGHFIAAPLFASLLVFHFLPTGIGRWVLKPSIFTVLLAAFLTAALIVPCHWDSNFQPRPARW